MARAKKPKIEVDLSDLNPIVARRVLQNLLELQPDLTAVVAELADELIKNPRIEDLAEEIEGKLNQISAGDIHSNSGRTWRGYREQEECVAEIWSEVITPYFERVQKLFRKKDEQNALTMCKAIILALYRLKHSDYFSELEEYAEDCPEETADWAARLWRSAGNEERAGDRRFYADITIPEDFVHQYVPEWDWLLSED